MEGFGGCFNEKGWDALSALNETQQLGVIEALFSMKDGLKYTINRMPIGSSDFADSYYSLDDSPGDMDMLNLSLARDRTKLLPYIKAAMAVNPALKVWGSPWSGPEWLKDSAAQSGHNEGCGSLDPSPAKRAAYALYLARAAKAYRAEGLNFEHLAIQNEPNQGSVWDPKKKKCGNSYPKMHWTGVQLQEFLRDHLGPTFAKEGIADTVGILLATFPVNDFNGFVQPTLSDPEALKYLAGVGLQYAGVGMISDIKKVKPTLKTWETETPCGGGRSKVCGSGPGTHDNSWEWGEGQWQYMRSFLESGVSVYSQWNMILDATGKSGWGWSQCSPVTIDTVAKTVTYEGSYWATKHFSFFVEPGAKMLTTTGDNGACKSVNGACGCAGKCTGGDKSQLVSFVNPGGEIVVVALNANDVASPVRISVDGKLTISESLPAHSMSTFVVSK
jgi:glucosylceramidase